MPRYEREHKWLSLLLDCYSVIDFSVQNAIEQSEKTIACYKGCTSCCYHAIYLSTIEAIGIKFYFQSILDQQYRLFIIKNLNEHKSICIFNVENCCAVYKMRPITCRRYIVCSSSCKENEDPTITRPSDVLEPSRELLYHAIKITLPFYKSLNIHIQDNEHIFDFYKRSNVLLSSVYKNIINPQQQVIQC